MASLLKLRVRPLFRKLGKLEQADWANAVAAASPPKARPDGRPTGGSLAAIIRAARSLRVTRWGYVLKLYQLDGKGHFLTFLLRGAVRRSGAAKGGRGRFVRGTKVNRQNVQPPRPIHVPDPTDRIADAVQREVQAQFAAWDRRRSS